MKKIAIWMLAGLLVVAFAAPAAGSDNRQDLKVIKKAVKENPSFRPGREVTRFNLEIRDRRGHKDKVRITVPLALFDLISLCADDERIRFEDSDIDFKELLRELKKAGPGMLLEIQDGHGSFKIWLD